MHRFTITLVASVAITSLCQAGRVLTLDELAAQIQADRDSVLGRSQNSTEAQRLQHNAEMVAEMNKGVEQSQKERQAAAAAQAERIEAARLADVKRRAEEALPKTPDDAKDWMIEHFRVPKETVTSFSVDGKPVTHASVSWKTFAYLRDSAGYWFCQTYYHDRTYDFLNQTLTYESDI